MDLLKDSVPLTQDNQCLCDDWSVCPDPYQGSEVTCCSIAVGGYACTCGGKPYDSRASRGDLETFVHQLGGTVIWPPQDAKIQYFGTPTGYTFGGDTVEAIRQPDGMYTYPALGAAPASARTLTPSDGTDV